MSKKYYRIESFILLGLVVTCLGFLTNIQSVSADAGGANQGIASGCQISDRPDDTVEVTWLTGVIPPDGLIIPCACIDSLAKTECGIPEALQVIVNITKLLLALTGSAALAMFIYGGILLITAGSNSEHVKKAKSILTEAVFGIAIILTAWIIINTIIITLTAQKDKPTNLGAPGVILETPLGSSPSAVKQP